MFDMEASSATRASAIWRWVSGECGRVGDVVVEALEGDGPPAWVDVEALADIVVEALSRLTVNEYVLFAAREISPSCPLASETCFSLIFRVRQIGYN